MGLREPAIYSGQEEKINARRVSELDGINPSDGMPPPSVVPRRAFIDVIPHLSPAGTYGFPIRE